MKVYFTASIAAIDQLRTNYMSIVDYLRSHGHTVVADHILESTEDKISHKTREERLKFHQQLEDWIKNADCMIAETSFPSISVGYEISLALKLGKPVLILYSKGDPPSLLAYHKDEKLLTERYTPAHVGETIKNFLSFVQGKSDMRFTFFITPSIAAYLEDVAREEKLPKSVYLRKLIEGDMRERRK
jgi:hypothetical protein